VIDWIFKHSNIISALLCLSLIVDIIIMDTNDKTLFNIILWVAAGKVLFVVGLNK